MADLNTIRWATLQHEWTSTEPNRFLETAVLSGDITWIGFGFGFGFEQRLRKTQADLEQIRGSGEKRWRFIFELELEYEETQ